MKKPWLEIAGILFLHLGIFTAHAQSLSIHATANKTTQITWASGITDLVLEETSALEPSALWRLVTQPPVLANNQYSVTLDASGGARFLRLRSGALEPFTTIRETSPADGETGVAVTRETIVFGGGTGGGGIFFNTMTVANSTTLSLGSAVVVRGQLGTVNGNGTLINQGLISADVARAAVTISPRQFENSGQLAATAAGATLTVRTKPFTNAGTFVEQNGGKVVVVP